MDELLGNVGSQYHLPAQLTAHSNAMCESFFATLECELLDRRRFKDQSEARMAVFEFLEGWYNVHRRHSGIGYAAPIEYEKRHANRADTAAL